MPNRTEILTNIVKESMNKQLVLSRMEITDAELILISHLIRVHCPNVQEIYLDNNKISDIGGKIIADCFVSFSELTLLDLQYNHLDYDGIREICSLKSILAIDLCLAGNRVKDYSIVDNLERFFALNKEEGTKPRI